MIKQLWHWLQVKLLCEQGMHGGNIVAIDENGAYELHCTRCGYVSYATETEFYWGYDNE